MDTIFQDCFGKEISLSESVWEHIKIYHPEITHEIILKVLDMPEVIVRSGWDFHSMLYYRKMDKYYKVVVTEMSEMRIKTALTTDKIKKGDIIWKRI